ncbi:YbaB/EbfC family nucleoid-associated protein [Brochothrix campestris]
MRGMGNMQGMMKKMQKMQKEMAEAQAELEVTLFEGTAGGGVVKVTVTGAKMVTNVELAEDVVDPEDIEMLQDLILTATNEAIKKVEEQTAKTMGKYTSGMNIPGLM